MEPAQRAQDGEVRYMMKILILCLFLSGCHTLGCFQ